MPEDRATAERLAGALAARGWQATLEPEAEALDGVRCVLVLWSKRSVRSEPILQAATDAARRRVLVPCLVEDVRMPLGFGRFHAPRLVEWQGEPHHADFERLCDAIAVVVPPSAKPAPAPRRRPPPEAPIAPTSRLFPAAPTYSPTKSPLDASASAVRRRWTVPVLVTVAIAGLMALGLLLVWTVIQPYLPTQPPAERPARVQRPAPAEPKPAPASSEPGLAAETTPVQVEAPLRVGGEVEPPWRLSGPTPSYTDQARKARIQGTVILEAIIDKQGNVNSVRVLKSLPMGLDTAAVEAVSQWKFQPATLDGKPVNVYYSLTVNFKLQ